MSDEYPSWFESAPPTTPSVAPPTAPPVIPPPLPPYGYQQAPPPPVAPHVRPGASTRTLITAMLVAAVMIVAFTLGGVALYQRGESQSSALGSSDTSASTRIIERHSVPPDVARTPTTIPAPNGSDSTKGTGSTGTVDADAVSAKVNPSVVDINTVLGFEGARAAGTGMVLTPTGRILTNNHVVNGATEISVTVVTTGKTYTAKVVGTVPTEDVAVLQLEGASGLTPITVADASKVVVGDPVVAIGNAGGTGGDPTVVTGQVTAINQSITAGDESGTLSERLHNLIRVDAPIASGDSGGPLTNAAGEIIGMNTAASATPQFESTGSVGYAIPIQQAMASVAEIVAGRASATVHLGLPGILGVEVVSRGGVYVAGVADGSAAQSIGLAAGSTITSIDGTPVSTPDALSQAMAGRKPGAKVKLGWTDAAGVTHTDTATLVAGPAD